MWVHLWLTLSVNLPIDPTNLRLMVITISMGLLWCMTIGRTVRLSNVPSYAR
jgi:hypothetical protein